MFSGDLMSIYEKMEKTAPFFLKPVFFITLAASILIFFFISNTTAHCQNTPVVKDGLINLTEWNFAKDGIVNLSGQWKFYWNRHIPPEQIGSQDLSSNSILMKVPGTWNGYSVQDKKISGNGYATYYLRVLIDPKQTHLALKLLDMSSSYRLYINGRQMASSGFPGKVSKKTIPYYQPMVAKFENHLAQLDIVVHVSNFHHMLGGLWEPILLGSEKEIRIDRERHLLIMFFLLGSIFIMGTYHLVLFGIRPKDRSTLYFGIFCLLISIRILCTGERYIIQIFPSISYEMLLKSIYISFYLCVPFFAMYTRLLFPKEVSNTIINLVKASGIFLSIFVLFLSAKIYTYSMTIFQVLTLLMLIYVVGITFQAVKKKRQGASIFAIGMGILSLSVVNDILCARQIISTGHFVPAGLFVFMFSQAVIITKKFSTAFATAEKQKTDLLMTISAYKDELDKRKSIQTALVKSERQFSDLFNSITDLIYTLDIKGRFISANPAMPILLGYDTDELLGRSVADFMEPKYKSEFDTGFLEVAKKQGYHEGIGCYLKKNGEKIYVEYKNFLINQEGDNPYISGIGKDVTGEILSDKKVEKLQKQRMQSQKMEAIGTLAGGIAHDFNNILSGIFGYAQLTEAHINEPEKAKKHIRNLLKGAQRASDVVRQILTFSRQSEYEKKPLKLSGLLNETLELIRSSIPSHIVIKKNIFSQKMIMADQTQIHQVIMNLCTNAYHAMNSKGGVLTVGLHDIEVFEQENGINIKMPAGNYIKLEISDTGHGIDKKNMDKIFDPYFTTKEIGKGTGMGLAMIDGIVKNHNGFIKLYSEVGHGTTFQVFWPVIEQNTSPASQV